jgi:hypothetical protein
MSTLGNGANYLIAKGRQYELLAMVVISLILNILLAVGFVKIGLDIPGIASSTVLTMGLLSLLVWRKVLYIMGYAAGEQLVFILKLYYPVGVLVGLIAAMNHVIEAYSLAMVALSTLLYVFLYAFIAVVTPQGQAEKSLILNFRTIAAQVWARRS